MSGVPSTRVGAMKPTDAIASLPFVTWDRGTIAEDVVTIFGWIPRRDGQRDFVYLEFSRSDGEVSWWATSSAKYSRQITKMFGGEHSDCVPWLDALAALARVGANHA